MPPPHYMRGPNAQKVSTFKIYLSNLPDSLNSHALRALFEEYGRIVECEVFKKNYAFVHMEEEECGRKAVGGLNRKEIDGKVISVSISKNMEPPNIATTKLMVKNLPVHMNAGGLRKLFQKFGLILEAEIIKNGNGIVSLEATGDIRTAMNEIGAMEMDGKKLLVEPVKVNLKAERYGPPSSEMEWNPKPPPSAYPQHSGYRQEQRAPPGHYALGGGYSAAAQAEEFYGQQEEYYEEEPEYYEEEEYYPPEVYPPPEYEAPVRRFGMPPSMHQQIESSGRGRGQPVLRAGVDFMRRGDAMYFEDEQMPTYDYGMRPPPPSAMVARNPPVRMMYGPPAAYGGGRGRGSPRGRGRGGVRGPAPVMVIPKRKVVRGEPYPAPPAPPARMLLAQGGRGGMRPRGGGPPRMMAPGVGGGMMIRPKSRGERGGKNTLTAGKLAKLEELKASGVVVPATVRERVELVSSTGFTPLWQIPKNNNPNSSGGGQGPSLLASARAVAVAHAAATGSGPPQWSGQTGGDDSDPFAPSAAEKRYLQQKQQQQISNANIDFTADIMLG